MRRALRLLCLGLLLLSVPGLSHAQIEWTGNGDGTSWGDAGNWTSSSPPGAGDDVLIGATPNAAYTVTLSSARTVASLTLNSSDATLEANADLTVNGRYSHENGRFTGSGTFTVEGTLNWERERMAGSGTTIANGGASIAGGLTLDTRRLVIPTGQTAVYTGAYDFVATNGAVLEIESGATFDIQDFGNLAVGSNSSSRPTIVNRGVFKKTSRGRTRVTWVLENAGTVEADLAGSDSDRRLRFTGPVTDNGGTYRATDGALSLRPPSSVTFGSGSQLSAADTATVNLGTTANNTSVPIDVEGTLDVKGILSVGGGDHAAVTVLSTATVTNLGAGGLVVNNRGRLAVETTDPLSVGDLTLGFEGRLTMNSDLTVTGAYTQDPDPSRFASDHALTVEGAFRWEGGTMAGSGTTVAESGLELTGGFGSSSNGKLLDERRLVVPTGETAAYPGAYLTGANGATIEVESGATFDIQGQAGLSVGSNSSTRPTLLNRGTLKKTGDYSTEIGWAVENEGLVEADLPTTGSSRYLRFTGPVTDNSGTYRALNGRLAFFATAQDLTFGSGSVIRADSSGTIRFGRVSGLSADTVSARIEGTYDVEGTTRIQASNDVASVTIARGATLQDLAASNLVVKESGKLTVEPTDPLTVGDLRLGNRGRLAVSSDLTVTGTYTQDPDPSTFVSTHALTVEGLLTWEGGTMAGPDTTVAKGGLRLPGGFGSSSNGKRLIRRVLVLPSGTAGIYSGAYLSAAEDAGLHVRPDATFRIETRGGLSVGSDTASHPSLRNEGTLLATNGRSDIEWDVTNDDTLDIKGPDGHLRFLGALQSTNVIHVRSNAQLSSESDSGLVNRGTLDVDGRLLSEVPVRNDGGTVTAAGPAEFVQGTVARIPNDPDTLLHMNGGEFRGNASISGHVVNDTGIVRPGGTDAAGEIDVQGIYAQRQNGKLDIELGGTSAGSEYDLIRSDRSELAGSLRLHLIDDYVPASTHLLTPVLWTDSTRIGSFDAVEGQVRDTLLLAVEYRPTALGVYDGSLTAAPSSSASGSVRSPPNVREDRQATFSFSASTSGIATVNPSGSGAEPIHDSCPSGGGYEEYKCRLERFGISPPEPPEGESYPDLGQEDLFTENSNVDLNSDVSPSGDKVVESGACAKEKECGGGELRSEYLVGAEQMTNRQFQMCAIDIAKLSLSVVPGSDCFTLAKTIGSKVGFGYVEGDFDARAYVQAAVIDAARCASDFTPGKYVKVAAKVHEVVSAAGGIKSAVSSCQPATSALAPKTTTTRCIGSTDPNDKFGPPGVNPEQYTTRQDSLPYTVFFENKPDATAPAQEVVITDTLTTDRFDASTFSFGPVAFGDTTIFPPKDTLQFSTTVDLRPDRDIIVDLAGSLNASSGILTWTFTSVDPDSSGLGATEGFLPPNDTPPEGEGSVSYFTSLRDTVSSGTQFGRAAEIVFDNNDPIATGVWSNVLDIAPPSSQVASLDPTQNNVDFPVEWGGTDAESGVQSYSVYVSKNGDAFTEWIADTTATSATFDGTRGAQYAFYSVATDSVGRTEPMPETADATTKVAADAIPVELTEIKATLSEEGSVALTWKTASETNNAGFEVQRTSGSEGSFRRVGFVEGAGTTSEPQTYRFTDEELPYAADTLRYRLRQVDTDGSAAFTDPVVVGRSGPEELELRETFPNPARNRVTVRYALPKQDDGTGEATVHLYDVLGRRVRTVRPDAEPGRHEVQLRVQDLASGVYVLRLRAGGQTRTQRLTVVR